ncbi:hypothetical protein [Actinoplanes sp. RD1]|nr:hypothetical protein [Actinoplanes sp. RD1]
MTTEPLTRTVTTTDTADASERVLLIGMLLLVLLGVGAMFLITA